MSTWSKGDILSFWGGRDRGWVEAKIVSVSERGVPTVIDPATGKRRSFPRERRGGEQ